MELALSPIRGWELPVKAEAVRPFKYLLFDLLHVTAEKNSAIDPQPIPFDHRNSVFTIKGMMKWGFSETRFSDRYLTNLPGSISVFRVFSLSWSCLVWFEDVIWMGVAAGGIRGKLRNYSKKEWMSRFVFRANCDMQMRSIFTLCSAFGHFDLIGRLLAG